MNRRDFWYLINKDRVVTWEGVFTGGTVLCAVSSDMGWHPEKVRHALNSHEIEAAYAEINAHIDKQTPMAAF